MTIMKKLLIDTFVDIVTEQAISVVALVTCTGEVSETVGTSAVTMTVMRVFCGVSKLNS